MSTFYESSKYSFLFNFYFLKSFKRVENAGYREL